MCGIAGIFRLDNESVSPVILKNIGPQPGVVIAIRCTLHERSGREALVLLAFSDALCRCPVQSGVNLDKQHRVSSTSIF